MANLDPMRRELQRKARVTARNTARDLESRLRRTSPVDSGNMRQRTRATSRTTRTGAIIDVIVDTKYAHIVRSGQRPHVITPRQAGGVLAFRTGGQLVFARSVNHPGALGNSWWDNALRDVPGMLQRNWRGAG